MATPHRIVIESPLEARCNPELVKLVEQWVSYTHVFYRQGLRRKERKETQKSFFWKSKGDWYIWSGLVPRVVNVCKDCCIELEVIDKTKQELDALTIYEAALPGIKFRDDQLHMINTFLDNPRGILKAPTGTGKTILGFGCLSGFEGLRILWLCHKTDLMSMAREEARSLGFTSVGMVGGGHAEYDCDLTIATRQSFRNIADTRAHEYDVVVVDEVHHITELTGEYGYILARMLAPIRLGLTATLHPDGSQARMTAEALIGPVIAEMTINDCNELGILAKPKIKILKMPKDHAIADMRKYADVYKAAITNRLSRNVLIAATAKKCVEANETVLIMINQIEHGTKIMEQLKALGVKAEFVRGSTDLDTRNQIKDALNSGKIKCVICSSVWTEGVNIPNLQNVICAGGGKSEIAALQAIGRGLRKTSDKEHVVIYDIFDATHHFLISHFGERLCLYLDNNWL